MRTIICLLACLASPVAAQTYTVEFADLRSPPDKFVQSQPLPKATAALAWDTAKSYLNQLRTRHSIGTQVDYNAAIRGITAETFAISERTCFAKWDLPYVTNLSVQIVWRNPARCVLGGIAD